MCEEELAISIKDLGKMYKLYKNPRDKIKDAFGLNFYKKNYYKEFWALRDINITVKKGERVGLIGHNGAGKSTLLKAVIGNIQPTEGTIRMKGNVQALLELGTGFHPEFTGRENIKASLAYQGLSVKKIASAETEIIAFTELGEYIDQPVRTYSAGMYSRLAFAAATAVCPEVLVIDEVLGAGDAYFMGKCVERMRNLTSEEGTTVLFVSHDLQSVQALCDRVIWIDSGKVRYDGEVLRGIKLYTQAVRKNEELRLKIRDMKISKNQAMVLDRKSDLYDEYLFHLTSEKEGKVCKVYRIDLYDGDERAAFLEVGAPMDNNMEADCHVIDDIESASWGKSKRDAKGFYREYNNSIGRSRHAPFRMLLSKAYHEKQLKIDVRMDAAEEDDVQLQLFDLKGGAYHTCPVISRGEGVYTAWIHPAADEQADQDMQPYQDEQADQDMQADQDVQAFDAATAMRQKSDAAGQAEEVLVDNIGTGQAKIGRVILKDKNGREGKVFSYRDNIGECIVDITFRKPRYDFIFVILVYSMKGDLVLSNCQQVTVRQAQKSAEIHYKFPVMRLGSGEYTMSIGIYDELDLLDNGKEQRFLALLDRGVSFKVENPEGFALNLGLFVSEEQISIAGIDKKEITCSLLV